MAPARRSRGIRTVGATAPPAHIAWLPIGERGDASSYYGYGYGYPAYSYGYGTGYSYQAYGYGYGTPVTATIRAEQGSGLERSFRYAPFSSTVSAIAPAPQPRAAARVPFIRITDSKL